MHKAIIKSNLKKRGFYEVYFSEFRQTDTGLCVLKTGESEVVYVPDYKIIKIVWDFKNCPRKN